MEKSEFRSALSGSGFTFKKKYGQNFISDEGLLARIVAGAEVGEEDTVIEIGCGAGTLTKELAKAAKFVYGYEIDSALKPVLARTLADGKNVKLIFGDFMRMRMDVLEKDLPPYKVVANLPYYITTPLIMLFLEHSKKCLSLTVMVQEEVALRLCARAGTADYGALTADVALRGECKILEKVGREKFTPSPNVDSAVVKIELYPCRLDVRDERVYKDVVRAAFSSRRKTLENNFMQSFNMTRAEAKDLLSSCGIAEGARGETLSPEQFAIIADKMVATK